MANTTINITTKYNGKGFDQVRKDGKKTAGAISSAFKNVAAGLSIGLIAREAFRFGKESIELAGIQAQAEAQLAARLKSTGGAAGLNAAELKKMARELQTVTNVSDEATIAAEAMLLSFTNIGSDTFPRTTRTVLDVATAMNNGATPGAEQLKNTAVQLGKALNDPAKGLTALTRVGVVFTEQQKQQIETLSEAGKTAEAQAIILGELEKEFGGSAEAAREADGGIQDLQNSIGDFKEAVGAAIKPNSEFVGLLSDMVSETTKGLNALVLLSKAHNLVNATGNKTVDAFSALDTAASAVQNPVGTLIQLMTEANDNTDEYADAIVQLKEEQAAVTPIIEDNTDATTENTEAQEAAAKSAEEAAKRQAKVAEIRQDFARSLIEIDEQTKEDVQDVWDEFYDDNRESWKSDHLDTVANIKEQSAKDIVKIDNDLQKNLEKNAKRLQKDLAKVNQDEVKQIDNIKRKAAQEDKADAKRRKIDTLADERLFNFELKQLAAEGNANAIKEALERREIEEEIAKEKAQVEQQIEDNKLQEDIRRVRENAGERRSELQAEAAERAEVLRAEAEESKALREEQLQAELQAEKDKLREEITARREAKDEKLALLEEGKQEAIKTLAKEMTETGDLTRSELGELVPVAGEFGDAAGTAFAEGLNKGFEENERISGMLGEAADFTSPSRAGSGRSVSRRGGSRGGFGANPGTLGFQHGGSFTVGGSGGPDSQLVQFMASPGEQVSISPQGGSGGNSINVTIQSPIVRDLADVGMINSAMQEFVDTILVPTLEGT